MLRRLPSEPGSTQVRDVMTVRTTLRVLYPGPSHGFLGLCEARLEDGVEVR